MYVCIGVFDKCIKVCIFVCVNYKCMSLWVCVFVFHTCENVCDLCVCTWGYMCICMSMSICVYLHVCRCMYACVYVCVLFLESLKTHSWRCLWFVQISSRFQAVVCGGWGEVGGKRKKAVCAWHVGGWGSWAVGGSALPGTEGWHQGPRSEAGWRLGPEAFTEGLN